MAKRAPDQYLPNGIALVDITRMSPGDVVEMSMLWKYFSVKTGPVVESLKLHAQVWAMSIYLLNTRINSTSSLKLYRDVGISQKTAWHLVHPVREAWAHDVCVFQGPVEVDETYIGGGHEGGSPGVPRPSPVRLRQASSRALWGGARLNRTVASRSRRSGTPCAQWGRSGLGVPGAIAGSWADCQPRSSCHPSAAAALVESMPGSGGGFPEGADGYREEPIAEAGADLTVVEHHTRSKSVTNRSPETAQASEIRPGHGARRLDFNARQCQRPLLNDNVDFDLILIPVVEELEVRVVPAGLAPQLLEDERFEKLAQEPAMLR